MAMDSEKKMPEWAEVSTAYEAFKAKIDASITLPSDRYKKSDGASVRRVYAEYMEKREKKPVVKVVLRDEDWNRKSGQEWMGDKLVAFDQGFVAAFVAVKGDDTTAEIWSLIPRKDWLDGEKIKFDVYVPTKVRTVPLANVSK